MKALIDRWNRFFFEPISTASLGIFRICFGVVILDSLIGRLPDRDLWYGEHGIVSLRTIESVFQGVNPIFSFFHLVPGSEPGLTVFFAILIAATICLIVGFGTRVSSVLVFIGLIALSNRNFFAENAGDDLIRINCFLLMFAPAGAAFSVDRWLQLRRGLERSALPLKAPWAQRLIQLQLAYVYLDTVYLKLHGAAWLDGTALYYALNYVELKRLDVSWLLHSLWQLKVATWSVLGVEASMFSLVWFRRFRYVCLLAALTLHLWINFAMQFPVFQYAMFASLLIFIEPADILRVMGRLGRRA